MPARIDELFYEIRLRQEQLERDIKQSAQKAGKGAEDAGKESGRRFGLGFKIALAAAIGLAINVIRKFAIDSVKEFAKAQTGSEKLTDSAEKMSLAWRKVKARVGEMIVSLFRLQGGAESAANVFEKFDAFLVEHRRGIIKLGNIFIGLGQIVHNTFKTVADAIVITLAGAHRLILQIVNGGIKALNFFAGAVDKILPGEQSGRIQEFDLSRTEELLDRAGANILNSLQGIGDGFQRIFSDEVPEALSFTVGAVGETDRAVAKLLETLRELEVPLSPAVSALDSFRARIEALGLDIVSFIPLANRLGLTIDELAEMSVGKLALELEKIGDDGILAAVNETLDAYEEITGNASDSTRDLVRDITDAARSAVDLARAFGVLDGNAAAAVNSLINVGSAIDRIEKGDVAGGIAQGVSGIAGFIAGVFGGESASEAVRRENTIALGRLRESIDRLANLFANFTGAATDRLLRLGDSGIPQGTGGGFGSFRTIYRLREEMDRLGITITELETFARAAGIPVDELVQLLRTGEGSFFVAATQWDGVQQALIAASEAAETFAQSMDRLRLEFELFDIDDPAERFRRVVGEAFGELGKLGQSFFRFDDLDLSTPEGVAQARERLRQGFRFLDDPNIPRGALFGNLTEAEFENLLREGNQILEQIEQDLGLAVGADGPGRAGFQVFRGVTEITGNRIAGLLTTIAYWTEQTARGVHGEGANLPPPNTGLFGPFQNPGLPPAPSPGEVTNAANGASQTPGLTIHYAPSIGGVRVSGVAGITAADVQTAVGSALKRSEDRFIRTIDQRLGQTRTRSRRATIGKLE